MVEAKWIGVIGSLSVALIALIMLFRERNWAQRKYKRELKLAVLQPDFIAGLRKELEKDVQDHVKRAMIPLAKEVEQIIADVKKQTMTSIDQTLTDSRDILTKSSTDQAAQLQTLITQDTDALRQTIKTLENDISATQTEYRQVLLDYRTQVLEKVKALVDEQAADILASYLQSSLSGLELGNQQEFILARLEDSKSDLLKELTNAK